MKNARAQAGMVREESRTQFLSDFFSSFLAAGFLLEVFFADAFFSALLSTLASAFTFFFASAFTSALAAGAAGVAGVAGVACANTAAEKRPATRMARSLFMWISFRSDRFGRCLTMSDPSPTRQ